MMGLSTKNVLEYSLTDRTSVYASGLREGVSRFRNMESVTLIYVRWASVHDSQCKASDHGNRYTIRASLGCQCPLKRPHSVVSPNRNRHDASNHELPGKVIIGRGLLRQRLA